MVQEPALPTIEEVLGVIEALLVASGELAPQPFAGELYDMQVVAELNPSFSNMDFDPDLSAFGGADRAFMERQRLRSFQDYELAADGTQAWPWVLSSLKVGRLAAPDWREEKGDPTGMLHVDIPLFTIDRTVASLSGQRHGLEDFVHWLRWNGRQWIL
jgi:hypothetical protein